MERRRRGRGRHRPHRPARLEIDARDLRARGRAADQMSAKPTLALLDLVASLDKPGRRPSSDQLAKLLAADRDVRDFIARARATGGSPSRILQRHGQLLRKADPAVFGARLRRRALRCLRSRHPDLAPRVLARTRHPARPAAYQPVGGHARPPGPGPGMGAGGVRCLIFRDLTGRGAAEAAAGWRPACASYASRLTEEDSERWRDEVARRLPPGPARGVGIGVHVEPPRPRRQAQDQPRRRQTVN